MIDLTKPIELMDGTEAVFICNSARGNYHLAIRADCELVYVDRNGQIGGVQVIRNRREPKKVAVEYWLNVYSNGIAASHDTKEHADEYAAEDRIACVHRYTIVEVGFGL